jgi:hypothetical protein
LERLLMLRLVDLLFDPDPETLLLRDFEPLLLTLLESLEDPLLETLLLLLFEPLEDPLFEILREPEVDPLKDLLFWVLRLKEPEAFLVLLLDPLWDWFVDSVDVSLLLDMSVLLSLLVVVPESVSELSLDKAWWPVITCISKSTYSGRSAISPAVGLAWFALRAVAIPLRISRKVSLITKSRSATGAIIMDPPGTAPRLEL